MRESRKRYRPTDADRTLVMLAVSCSYTHEQIRFLVNQPFGLALNTMKKHFEHELGRGADMVNIKVVANLARIAMTGADKSAVTAGIYWTKNRMRDVFNAPAAGAPVSATLEMTQDGIPTKAGSLAGGQPVRFTLTMGEAPGRPKDDDESEGETAE